MSGKGSTQRPTDHAAFSKAFDRIFGDKNAPTSKPKGETDSAHPENEGTRSGLRTVGAQELRSDVPRAGANQGSDGETE